jgi:hypothetical protein
MASLRRIVQLAALIGTGLSTAAGASYGQANVGLGGVRSEQPRTNGFMGGVPLPPTAPMTAPAVVGPGISAAPPIGMVGGGMVVVGPGIVGSSGLAIGGDGLTVDGSYTGDRLRLGFHVGAGGLVRYLPPRRAVVYSGYPYYPWGSYDPYCNDGYQRYTSFGGGYGGFYDPALVWPGYNTPAPQPQPEPTPPLTSRELGDLALKIGEPEAAIDAYRKHLDAHPDDPEVMRRLGMAMIDARNVREGVAMVALAYRTDPRLCERPVPADLLGEARADLRTAVNRVSIYANNTDLASAWLTMAVLVQSEGRTDVARRMAERARTSGLDEALALRFIGAVSK